MQKYFSGIAALGLLCGCTADREIPAQAERKLVSEVPNTPSKKSRAALRPRSNAVASLADRGELLAYDRERQLVHAGMATFHPVAISEQHALNAIGAGKLVVTSPKGLIIRLNYLRHVEHPGDRWTWIGQNVEGAVGTLTFSANGVSGLIPHPGDLPLRVGSSDEGAWLATTGSVAAAVQRDAPFSIAPVAEPAALMNISAPSSASALMATVAMAETASSDAKSVATPTSLRMARHDINRDGRADILWSRPPLEAQHQSIWFMNGFVVSGGRYLPQPFHNGVQCCSSTILGAADLDGDGAADFFRREHDDFSRMTFVTVPGPHYDRLEEHGFVPGYPHRYPVQWHMAGLLDMNGDGKSDIAWTHLRNFENTCLPPFGNPAPDQLSRWFMDAQFLIGGRLDTLGACTSVASSDIVVTPGDFDGNGLGDFFYRREMGAEGRVGQVFLTDVNGVPTRAGNDIPLRAGNDIPLSASWSVVGSGDMNHDGKADLVLRHDLSGEIMIWFMDGAVITGTKNEPQSPGWKVVAVADFDGNGHDDLLWTNIEPDAASENGHLLMWLMRADGAFEGSYVGSYPKGWRVVNSTY